MKELLARHGRAKQVEGYRFTSADAVSADGRSMAGRGTNPKGEPITWFITIPSQPSTGTNRDTIVGLVADRLSQAFDSTVLQVRWVDNDNFIVGDIKGNLTLMNSDGLPLAQHIAHGDRVSTIASDDRNNQLLTGSFNGEIRLWPEFTHLVSQVTLTGCRRASSMHLDRKNQGLVVVSDNGEYDLLDLDKRRWTETHRILWDHRNAVDRSALSPDGRSLPCQP